MEEGGGSPARMFLAGLVANLPGLSAGLSMGFSAILIPQLQQPGSEISATLEEGSWIASLFVIGDLLGCVIGGPIADRFGRRAAILLDCLPLTVGWLLTWQATSLHHLFIARTITGLGIGAGVPIASISSLALMMTANLAAGLVLLEKHTNTTGLAIINGTQEQQDHLTIVEADNIIGLEAPLEVLEEPPRSTIVSLIPVFSCIFITFGYACGLGPVPFILFGELFPSSVRGNATSITAFLRSITVFLSIKIFPSLLQLCDIGGSFLSCAFVCGLAIVVSFFFVPETRGMDLEQLENIYREKKPQQASPEVSESLLSAE